MCFFQCQGTVDKHPGYTVCDGVVRVDGNEVEIDHLAEEAMLTSDPTQELLHRAVLAAAADSTFVLSLPGGVLQRSLAARRR